VKAGAVLGFVGNSGDAITTPPHLHFEAHPASLLPLGYDDSAVDPYNWVVGLQHLRDVEFPFVSRSQSREPCCYTPPISPSCLSSTTARSMTCSGRRAPARRLLSSATEPEL